jgi:hypothetical protein
LGVLTGDPPYEPDMQRVVDDGSSPTGRSNIEYVDGLGFGHLADRDETLDEQTGKHIDPQLGHVIVLEAARTGCVRAGVGSAG